MSRKITIAGHEFSLLAMTWPVFIELLLQMLVGNIDQIMLSRYNATAVAAVGNANQIMTTLILTFNVISPVSYTHLDVYKRQLLHINLFFRDNFRRNRFRHKNHTII